MMTWTFLRFYENLQRQLIKQMCLAYLCFMLFSLKSSQTWSRNTSAGAVEAKACSPNLKSTPIWDQLLLLSLKCPGVNGDTTESPHVQPSDDCPASLRNSPRRTKELSHPDQNGGPFIFKVTKAYVHLWFKESAQHWETCCWHVLLLHW